MSCAIFTFAESAGPARELAQELDVPLHLIKVRHFPDGESLVRVDPAAGTALLYCSLDNANAKMVELLLAASALGDNGAERLILVAPYLAYMRQDMAFQRGEAVSQKVIGALLAANFDGVITLDPHLHRVHDLAEAIPGIEAVSLSAAPALASALDDMDNPVLIGPDGESRQWVEAIACPRHLDILIGQKRREGDREVEITIPAIHTVAGRPVVLVDDVISSGATLIAAGRLALEAGAAGVEALASHCLATPDDLERMRLAGIARIRSTQSVAGPTAYISIATLLAGEIRGRGWLN